MGRFTLNCVLFNKIFLIVVFSLFFVSISALDFNIKYLDNTLDQNYINIDTNQAIIRFDIDYNFTNSTFDLNSILVDINSSKYFTKFYIYEDTNTNLIFDTNDQYIDSNLVFSDLNIITNHYDLNINLDIYIYTNNSLYLVTNLNSGITNLIDFNIMDINVSIDKNINYINDINYIIAPKQIIQNGFFNKGLLSLDHYSFGDLNGNYVDSSNLNNILDLNQFRLFIDGNDFRDFNYFITTNDFNQEDYRKLFFNLGNGIINYGSLNNFVIDYNISYFTVLNNLYYLVDDSNLYIYDYNTSTYDFNLISSLDTNDEISSIEVFNSNNSNYLFLANNGNGISIYNITDTNVNDINNHLVGNVVYNNGIDYNTTFIYSFVTSNDLNYIVASTSSGYNGAVVFYKVEDLIALNPVVAAAQRDNTSSEYRAGKFWHDLDNNSIYIPYEDQAKTTKVVYNFNSTTVNINSVTNKNQCFLDIYGFKGVVFALNSDYSSLSSYDLENSLTDNFEYFSTAISTYDANESIYAVSYAEDYNQIYLQLENKLIVLDYNFENNTFLISKIINSIITNTNNNIQYLNYDINTLYLGQANKFSKYDVFDYNFMTYYYLPYVKASNLSLSNSSINYGLYNNTSFDGNITISFNVFDYNTQINTTNFNAYTLNLYLKNNNNTYNIQNDVNLDLDICTRDNNRTYNCDYNFNIKTLNNNYNIEYGNYTLYVDFIDNNYSITTNFIFNLTNNSGGSGNSSNNSSGPSSGGGTPITNDPKAIFEYLDNIILLKEEYNNTKRQFNNHLISYPNLSFDINSIQSLINFKIDYFELLEKYNALLLINLKPKQIITKDLSYTTNNYNIVDKNIIKSAREIEITDNNTTINYLFIEIKIMEPLGLKFIIDEVDKNKIINSTSAITEFIDNKYIKITKDTNYLVSLSDYMLTSLKTPIVLSNKNKSKQVSISFENKIEEHKGNNQKQFFIPIIITIALSGFVYLFFNFKRNKIKNKKK